MMVLGRRLRCDRTSVLTDCFSGIACLLATVLVIGSSGCSGGGGGSGSGGGVRGVGIGESGRATHPENRGTSGGGTGVERAGRSDLPAAIAGGVAISRDSIFARLAETSGGAVLEEMILDQRLHEEARRRGMTITSADLAREQRALVDAIRRASNLGDREAEEALVGVRRRRGLGPIRFEALLRRNAILRRLASESVRVSEDDVRLAHRIRYGERYMLSLIVTGDERSASSARRLLMEGQPVAGVAGEFSIDPSAASGGRVGPISPFDPSLPEALTAALRTLGPGRFSSVIAIENGYAIVRIDEVLASRDVGLESVRDELTSEIRRVRERAEMDRVARNLLDLSQITVFDSSLRWSWESGGGSGADSAGSR